MGRTEGRTGLSESDQARRIRSGDIRALARAATAIENRQPEAESLLRELFPRTGRALVIGVTGSPGAGKSTLAGQLIKVFREQGRTVGVVAVDPTSPYSGGAILGDRIRMQAHHDDPGVFIRSMATRGWLGGLARATTDLVLLLDAAGRDVVIVETVGVGQDEVDVARLAGVTVVVLVPGMGDDVQAIKAGLMEIADVFVINKADHAGADRLDRELHQLPAREDGTAPPVLKTVASEGTGVAELAEAIRNVAPQSGRLERLWELRLREMLRERLLDRYPPGQFAEAARQVAARQTDPYTVVEEWLRT